MSGKSFFLRGKKNTTSKVKATRGRDRNLDSKRKHFSNEEIESDEELEETLEMDESDVSRKKRAFDDAEDGSGSDVDETAQQKRLRLAEAYLSERAHAIEQEGEEDDDEELNGALSRRLEDEILDRQGKLIQRIADSITLLRTVSKQRRTDGPQSIVCDPKECQSRNELRCVTLRGHRRTVTCVALSATGAIAFSGSKDGSLAKWDALTGKRERLAEGGKKQTQEAGHKHAVLSVATSCDDKFVASGDARGTILVWTFGELRCLRALTGHRGAVTALAFRKVPFAVADGAQVRPTSASASASATATGAGRKRDEAAHTLFSASADRTVKQWDVDQLAYVDTMLGHEDAITGLDALFAERCVTSGGRDASLRVFKPALESQLVFHGDGAAIECVAALSDRFFVSGSDRNSVSLWNVMRKKPVRTIVGAHASDADGSAQPHDVWISAIAAVPNSDVFATGARDGFVRLWQCKVDADADTEADGDGQAPARRRIALIGDSRRQQSEQLRGLRPAPLLLVPVRGVVNALSMRVDADADELVVAVAAGREHKAGRWWNVRDAQNVVRVFRFALDKRVRFANGAGTGTG